MSQKITLGDHEYKVVAQPIGWLTSALSPASLQELLQEQTGVEGLAQVPAQAYGVLRVFIPGLMPLHEFLGYRSQDALEANEYERDADRSPTGPQIIDAFKVASKANGGDVLRHLKAIVAPEMIQKFVTLQVAKMAEGAAEEESSTIPSATSEPSPNSPPTSGESVPTSSGATPPTATPSAA